MDADFITKQELETLMDNRSDVCLSIYLPMTRVGSNAQNNHLRLKNALKEVENKLEDRGWRRKQIEDLLREPRALLKDSPFWQHQLDGLAVFLAPDFYETYRLPLSFNSLTIVGERFHIKPLLPLFSDDGRFYILALSQNKVRLFQGTRHVVDEMEIDPIPGSLAEALQYDDPETQLQHHTTTSASQGGPEVVHHGHGLTGDEKRQRLRRFLNHVSKGLRKKLANENAPLVLAAVDYLQSIYKKVDSSPHVLDEGIVGNPDEMSAQELHEKAWAIVEPLFNEAKEDVQARYSELLGSQQASDDLEEVVPAAFQGRVDALFVALDSQKWGRYDPETNVIKTREEPKNGDEDLLDFVAMKTLAYGGTVYAVDAEEVPGQSPLAAVFRF